MLLQEILVLMVGLLLPVEQGQNGLIWGFTGTFNTLTGTNGGQIGAIRIDGTTILTDPARPVGRCSSNQLQPIQH